MCLVTVHMLASDADNPHWRIEAVSSIPSWARVILADIGGRGVGANRAMQFECSNTKYVSYVDPDDRVLPGALEACVALLEQNPNAGYAYTFEELIDETGTVIRAAKTPEDLAKCVRVLGEKHAHFNNTHHITVYRRNAILEFLPVMAQHQVMAEQVLNAKVLARYPVVCTGTVGYQWRQHGAQLSKNYDKADRNEDVLTLGKLLKNIMRKPHGDGHNN